MKIDIEHVELPSFGRESALPDLPASVLLGRLERVVARMRRAKLDILAVYGDREHFANLAYLTGLDPRFEEALLLLAADGRAKLLVGNECMGYLPDTTALGLEVELFQEFSLLGQPRGKSRPLRRILRDFGVHRGVHVGCVGWKYFDGRRIPAGALDVPAYLADALDELCGGCGKVVNATAILMDARDGLRVTNEPEQIAQFEYASAITSTGVLNVLRHLKPGVQEQNVEKHLDSHGLPLTVHRMLSFGAKAQRGLASASANRARLGDAYTTAFGVMGALTCRAGVIARNSKDLPAATKDFYPRFAANYFAVVATWYERVKVGAVAGDVVRAVERVRGKRLYEFAVNPGHYLHLDEWVHSPFTAGSRIKLRSGMVIQADIIPVSKGPFCYVNAEDGVVLADESLRAELARRYPALWQRVRARQAFMRNTLGIRIDDSVLPLSNTPAWLPPYVLDLKRAFVRVRA